MDNTPLISIIVPVYKVEKYIDRCMNSIMEQTFSDYEVILIDDGSPDSCGDICDDIALSDGRVKVIHTDNKGAAAARNIGIDNAQGEYLLFVDADDELENNMLDKLYSMAVEHNADMVICNSIRVYEDIDNDYVEPEFDGHVFSGGSEDMFKMMFSKDIFRWEPWGKLIKKSLFCTKERHRFIEGIVYEDLYLIPRIIDEADNIVYIDLPLYRYTIRKGSVMSYDNGLIVPYALVTVTKENIEYFRNNNKKNLYEMISAFLYEYIYASLCSVVLHGEEEKNKEFIAGYLSFMKKNDKYIRDNSCISKKKPIRLSYNNYKLFILMRKVLKKVGRYNG